MRLLSCVWITKSAVCPLKLHINNQFFPVICFWYFDAPWSFHLFNSLTWMIWLQWKRFDGNCFDIADDRCENDNRNTVMQDDWNVGFFLIVWCGCGGSGGLDAHFSLLCLAHFNEQDISYMWGGLPIKWKQINYDSPNVKKSIHIDKYTSDVQCLVFFHNNDIIIIPDILIIW